MTEDERKAMEWLDEAIADLTHCGQILRCVPAAYKLHTLKSLLSRPVLPDVCDHKAIDDLHHRIWEKGYGAVSRDLLAAIIGIMREPPAPRTKEVEVYGWALMRGDHVITVQQTERDARGWIPAEPDRYTVVRLTGKAMVPS